MLTPDGTPFAHSPALKSKTVKSHTSMLKTEKTGDLKTQATAVSKEALHSSDDETTAPPTDGVDLGVVFSPSTRLPAMSSAVGSKLLLSRNGSNGVNDRILSDAIAKPSVKDVAPDGMQNSLSTGAHRLSLRRSRRRGEAEGAGSPLVTTIHRDHVASAGIADEVADVETREKSLSQAGIDLRRAQSQLRSKSKHAEMEEESRRMNKLRQRAADDEKVRIRSKLRRSTSSVRNAARLEFAKSERQKLRHLRQNAQKRWLEDMKDRNKDARESGSFFDDIFSCGGRCSFR
jgi:hypothetical protein